MWTGFKNICICLHACVYLFAWYILGILMHVHIIFRWLLNFPGALCSQVLRMSVNSTPAWTSGMCRRLNLFGTTTWSTQLYPKWGHRGSRWKETTAECKRQETGRERSRGIHHSPLSLRLHLLQSHMPQRGLLPKTSCVIRRQWQILGVPVW